MEAHAALPCTSGSASSVISTERAQTTEATSSSSGTVTSTFGRLRNDLISASSASVATTTVGASLPQSSSSSRACFVDGASKVDPLEKRERPVRGVVAERSAERGALRLAVDLDLEAAHHGRERRRRRR